MFDQALRLLTRPDVLTAIAALVLALPAAYLARWFLQRVVARVAAKTETTLDDELISALSRPLLLGVLLLGVYIALSVLQDIDILQAQIDKGLHVAIYALAVYTGIRVFRVLVDWYGREVATRMETPIDDKLLPVVRRLGNTVLLAVGALLILDSVGIQVGTLIAALGIGGLAVALAVQPTLSNVFAGAYILSDGSIKHGDFIQIESGTQGYVQDVGWRTTRIRTLQNNLVIIPNSKLADSVVTNFHQPDVSVGFFVDCGVSYDSDLHKVEKVALEVARKVMLDTPAGVKDFTPTFWYTKFGDSNIEFVVALRAVGVSDQYVLKHAFIQQITHRFRGEGIEIAYPTRTVHMRDGVAPAPEGSASARPS
ncbi:MAG: mechanosensitive ion channel family protein [Dehalococcoidia bacterium]|nr:mechanosensitive ion channel family protein [Dehalococcoidia bacterium]